jgi:hypothetical protein
MGDAHDAKEIENSRTSVPLSQDSERSLGNSTIPHVHHKEVGHSLWYLHPLLYDLGMLLINGKFYLKIYKEIAKRIPAGSTVLDVGAGPCTLAKYLDKSVEYEAWDANDNFVRANQRAGVNAKLKDCIKEEFPSKDYVVVSGVLHHVHPHEELLIKKSIAAATKGVIVVEPFANPPDQSRRVYRWLRKIRRKSFLERFIGEYDGTNSPDSIVIKTKEDLLKFLNSLGPNNKEYIGDEIITVYEK